MKKLEKQYNQFAGKYTDLHVNENHGSTDVFFNIIKKYFPEKGKQHLLDLGCGAGSDFNFYLSNNFVCAGADTSSEMCLLAKQAEPRLDIRNEDFSQTSFDNESFHFVTTKWALQTSEEIEPVYKEVHRVLVPLGYFCFLTVHPLRQFLEKKHKKKNYFKQEIVESLIFDKQIKVHEPTHTLEEYLSAWFLKHFDLIHLHEGYEFPSAEQIGGDTYPTYLIVIAQKK